MSASNLAVPLACLSRAHASPLGRFIRVLDAEEKICEYNQEACRINAFDGKKSLIRSFP